MLKKPRVANPGIPVQPLHHPAEEVILTKRTQIVVDRKFQQRVALNLMLIVLFLPLVLLANFYAVGTYTMTQNLEIADLPRDWGLVGQMIKYQWWLLLVFVGVSLVFTLGLIFYYTHRIAGPVYRFRRLFDEIAEGKVGAQVQLRKGDCFENLAASVSRANATLAQSIVDLKSAAAVLSKKADALGDRELGEQIAVVNRVLARYQVAAEPFKTAAEPMPPVN